MCVCFSHSWDLGGKRNRAPKAKQGWEAAWVLRGKLGPEARQDVRTGSQYARTEEGLQSRLEVCGRQGGRIRASQALVPSHGKHASLCVLPLPLLTPSLIMPSPPHSSFPRLHPPLFKSSSPRLP